MSNASPSSRIAVLASLFAAVLAACGGGGSDTPADTAPATNVFPQPPAQPGAPAPQQPPAPAPPAPSEPAQPSQPSQNAAFVGAWDNVTDTQSASVFEFRADGTYTYSADFPATSVFIQETGKYAVAASEVTLDPTSRIYRQGGFESPDTLTRRTLAWRIARDAIRNVQMLTLTDAFGTAQNYAQE